VDELLLPSESFIERLSWTEIHSTGLLERRLIEGEPVMDCLVRRARTSDLEKLVELRIRVQEHMEASSSRVWRITEEGKRNLRKTLEESLSKKDGLMLVAEKDNDLMGFIYGEVTHRPDYLPPGTGQISLLYVKEDFRRHGLGSTLVKELCRFFRNENIDEVTLRYVLGNIEGERFWSSLGFKPVLVTVSRPLRELEQTLNQL